MSTQEIVSQVFDDHGFHAYEFRGLSAGQTRRIYTVQYRESGEITLQGTKIELRTGASTITMDASGITLSGPLIKIN